MKMTSAYANKLLKSLADEKSYWTNKEEASRTYVAAVGEEPVIPEYDYSAVSDTLNEIDRKTVIIRHALNLANATAKIPVGDTEMSVDSILVKMAQLNYRKTTLDTMRKYQPKTRRSIFKKRLRVFGVEDRQAIQLLETESAFCIRATANPTSKRYCQRLPCGGRLLPFGLLRSVRNGWRKDQHG